jgi:hypothetical protein
VPRSINHATCRGGEQAAKDGRGANGTAGAVICRRAQGTAGGEEGRSSGTEQQDGTRRILILILILILLLLLLLLIIIISIIIIIFVFVRRCRCR